MLTDQQRKLAAFIEGRLIEDGRSPTFREMCDFMGLNSTSGVHRMVQRLIDLGVLRRAGPHHTHRCLEIAKPHTNQHPEYLRGYADGVAAAESGRCASRGRPD